MPGESLNENEQPRHEIFINELSERLENPIHKRVLKAYHSPDPVRAMETELGKILLEVLENED